MAISGLGVAYAGAGFVLLWSGVKNATLKDTLTSFLKGQAPTANPTGSVTIGLDSESSSSSSSGTAGTTSSAIANDALKYVGHKYVFGGSPGTNGQGGWDCSSMVNWVLGHDLGMRLPGESTAGYSGTSHGPTTVGYLGWSGASTISNKASAAQPGDLCVWQTHIGIATGGGNMVSALDEAEGTKETTIGEGSPSGELLFVRRIKGTS